MLAITRGKTTRPNILFCKIINGLTSVDTSGILLPADSHKRANHKFKFKYLQSKCEAYKHSLSPATIPSWNSLPFDIVKASNWGLININIRPP